jgi:hypothetical protein
VFAAVNTCSPEERITGATRLTTRYNSCLYRGERFRRILVHVRSVLCALSLEGKIKVDLPELGSELVD